MATPLSIYTAAERYVTAATALDPSIRDAATKSQYEHVTEVLGKMTITCEHATELLEAIANPASVFTDAQRKSIGGLVNSIVSGTTSAAVQGSRPYVKEQTNLYLHAYLPAKLWACLESGDTFKTKLRQMSMFMNDIIGLRNPSAPTKVRVVALIHAASKMDASPQDGYDAVHDLAKIMKATRDRYRTVQTLKVFPKDPAEFMRRYPGAYPASDPPVACPIVIADIDDRSR